MLVLLHQHISPLAINTLLTGRAIWTFIRTRCLPHLQTTPLLYSLEISFRKNILYKALAFRTCQLWNLESMTQISHAHLSVNVINRKTSSFYNSNIFVVYGQLPKAYQFPKALSQRCFYSLTKTTWNKNQLKMMMMTCTKRKLRTTTSFRKKQSPYFSWTTVIQCPSTRIKKVYTGTWRCSRLFGALGNPQNLQSHPIQHLPAAPPPPLKAFGRSKAHHQLPCVWRQERNVGYRMIIPDDYVVKKNAAKTSLLNKLLCVFSVSVCLQIHNLLFHFSLMQ